MESRLLSRAYATIVLLLCLLPSPAWPINYQHYAVGERAAGMGGAFIALSDDGSGGYYNPAGLAFADSNRFSVTGTVYGFSQVTLKDASMFESVEGDMNLKTFYAHPSSFGTVYRFNTLSFKDPGPKPNVFGINIVQPDYFVYRNLTEFEGGQVQLTTRQEVRTFWAGPSYARRLNKNWSAGTTLFGLFGMNSFYGYFSGRLTGREIPGLQGELVQGIHSEEDTRTLNFLLQVGGRYTWKNWNVGLVARSPSVQVWGDGAAVEDTLWAYQGQNDLEQKEVDFHPKRVDPLMVGLGGAYVAKDRWALTADVKVHGPAAYDSADKDEVSDSIRLNTIVNGNLGGEYIIKKRIPLRAGIYTNFSPNDIGPEDDGDHVDMYGATLSGGMHHKQVSFSLGFNYAWGMGYTYWTRLEQEGGELNSIPNRVDVTVTTINFFMATSYRFGFSGKSVDDRRPRLRGVESGGGADAPTQRHIDKF